MDILYQWDRDYSMSHLNGTTVVQQKTGRPVQFELTEPTRTAIREWLGARAKTNSAYVSSIRVGARDHISTRQYARLVHRWIRKAGLAPAG